MSITEPALPELRHACVALDRIELREPGDQDNGGDTFTLTGHAAVFELETELFDAGHLKLRERIARGAFTRVLASQPDVHLTIGHDMDKALARTGVRGVGRLDLSEDEKGLRVRASIDASLSYARDLAILMKRKIIDQMSFAFTVAKDERTVTTDDAGNDDELRTIVEIGNLYDVSVLAQGAYSQTDAAIRAALFSTQRVAPVTNREGTGMEVAPVLSREGSQLAPDVAPVTNREGTDQDKDNRRRERLRHRLEMKLKGTSDG